jgi:peptide/nickel transport system permease protein
MTSVGDRAPVTVFLSVYAFAIAVILGVPMGVLAAVKARGPVDRSVIGLSVVGASAPVFVTGLVLLYLFGVTLGVFPIYGQGGAFVDRLWHLTLPALALALSAMALIVKITRTAMIIELGKDYVAFARARGVPAVRVVIRHALRNALVPLITAAAIVLTSVITGAVLVESVFAIQGLGALLVESVQYQDLPTLQAVTLLAAALVIGMNIVVDILYVLIDPRIRLGGRER